MSITVTTAESKQNRLKVMRKGVVAAALSIDNKFRADLGDPIFKALPREVLYSAKNPYSRTSPYRVALITLTYSPLVEWQPCHIRECLNLYATWFRRRKLKFHYVWAVELQGNGRPHYHVVMWFPKGATPPFPDKAGWWKHGNSNAKFAVSPVGYIAKYVSKSQNQSGHHLPKGARLWAHGGLTVAERAGIAYAVAPKWLKALVTPDSHPRKRAQVSRTHRTAAGVLLDFSKQVASWVATAGDGRGWGYVSPYTLQDIGVNGLVLSHTGIIEAISPFGESFFISHRN